MNANMWHLLTLGWLNSSVNSSSLATFKNVAKANLISRELYTCMKLYSELFQSF